MKQSRQCCGAGPPCASYLCYPASRLSTLSSPPSERPVALSQVSKVPELDKWHLYLVDWGYNTPEERTRADADPRITLLSKAAFLQLTSA